MLEARNQPPEPAVLGMWVFLATEVMLFGALFMALSLYRATYPAPFIAASHHLELWLGVGNTAILLTSSLAMAFAVRAAEQKQRGRCMALLGATGLLGAAFLALKALEYYHHYQHHLVPTLGFVWPGPQPAAAQLFFYFYFLMTGLHALHMLIGLGLLSWLVTRFAFGATRAQPVTIVGLYWHFVDVVWIFLFPMLYLLGHR